METLLALFMLTHADLPEVRKYICTVGVSEMIVVRSTSAAQAQELSEELIPNSKAECEEWK